MSESVKEKAVRLAEESREFADGQHMSVVRERDYDVYDAGFWNGYATAAETLRNKMRDLL